MAVTGAWRTAGDAVVQSRTPSLETLTPSLPKLRDREREREWTKPEPRKLVTDDAVVDDETASDKPKTLDPLCLPHPNTQTPETLIPCLNSTQGDR